MVNCNSSIATYSIATVVIATDISIATTDLRSERRISKKLKICNLELMCCNCVAIGHPNVAILKGVGLVWVAWLLCDVLQRKGQNDGLLPSNGSVVFATVE
jgi:hypothetical protein